jgi:diaminopimelate epimerase
MRIDKFQASGNDFIIIEGFDNDNNKRKEITEKACNRHFGIGSDGALFLDKKGDKTFYFRIWNNDGTEAEISGNGLINAGAYVFDKYGDDVGDEVVFDTKAGDRVVKLIKEEDNRYFLKVDMGEPKFSSEDIPFYDGTQYQKIIDYPLNINRRVFSATILSVGNPHTVIFLDNFPSSFELQQIGREIESHPFFPNKTNVEFVRMIDKKTMEILFWERGAGETLSSGSGSTASVVAARLKRLVDEKVRVITRAGDIIIECQEDKIFLNGVSAHVFSGEIFI